MKKKNKLKNLKRKMSLPNKYLKKEHMEELKNLKDENIYYTIQELYKELDILKKEGNRLKDIQTKKLNELYDNIKETIKYISFILGDYIKIDYNYTDKTDIENILYVIEQIEQILKNLKSSKIKSVTIEKIINELLIFVRLLSLLISELIKD